jgi:hypothetical protein
MDKAISKFKIKNIDFPSALFPDRMITTNKFFSTNHICDSLKKKHSAPLYYCVKNLII